MEKKYAVTNTFYTFFGFLIQATVSTYFANYMTDTVMIPSGIASIIMLVACIWDAVNDPMMGAIADRTHTKWGRFRPYVLFAGPLLMVISFFLFRSPNHMSASGKVAYIAIFYILYGMTVTVYTVSRESLIASCLRDMKKRNKVYMLSGIAAGVAFTIASSFSENIAGIFGGGTWSWNMVLYGLPLILFGALLFRNSRENAPEREIAEKAKTDKSSFIRDLKVVLSHKEIWVCGIIWMTASLGYGLMFSSSVSYIKYVVATDMSQWALIGTYMLIVSLGALVSMAVLQPIILKAFKFVVYKGSSLGCVK